MTKIRENIILAPYTTFKIGGPARYFSEAATDEEIAELCRWAKKESVPVLALAGGSNILISDKGFDGLVIRIQNTKYNIKDTSIYCDAGIPLAKLVIESANAGLTGLEWAIGIPGTIGGAIYGNSGAYGHSISESVSSVKALSINNFSVKEYSREECGFVYRGSIFSAKGGSASGGKNFQGIIINAELKLSRGNKNEILENIKNTASQRKTKIPLLPSAGSFFKNYKIQAKNYGEDPLLKKFPNLSDKIRGGKIGVGYLLEECGLKGKRVGGAMVSIEHANFIVNAGKATAKDVLALANLCKKEVLKKYGIEIESEKRLIGF